METPMHPDAWLRMWARAMVQVKRELMWRAIARSLEEVRRDVEGVQAAVEARPAPKEDPR